MHRHHRSQSSYIGHSRNPPTANTVSRRTAVLITIQFPCAIGFGRGSRAGFRDTVARTYCTAGDRRSPSASIISATYLGVGSSSAEEHQPPVSASSRPGCGQPPTSTRKNVPQIPGLPCLCENARHRPLLRESASHFVEVAVRRADHRDGSRPTAGTFPPEPPADLQTAAGRRVDEVGVGLPQCGCRCSTTASAANAHTAGFRGRRTRRPRTRAGIHAAALLTVDGAAPHVPTGPPVNGLRVPQRTRGLPRSFSDNQHPACHQRGRSLEPACMEPQIISPRKMNASSVRRPVVDLPRSRRGRTQTASPTPRRFRSRARRSPRVNQVTKEHRPRAAGSQHGSTPSAGRCSWAGATPEPR